MAQRSRVELKEFFKTDDIPTEAQFGDLIDSSPNIVDDEAEEGDSFPAGSGLVKVVDGTPSLAEEGVDYVHPSEISNIDNTSDEDKPVSSAQASAISAAVSGVTKNSLGLGNVDNTPDSSKPVSTAQAAAISAAMQGQTGKSLTPVQDLAAAKAINTTSATDYPDKATILIEDLGFYKFDRNSTATNDDSLIIQPTTGVGRFLKLFINVTTLSQLTGDSTHRTVTDAQIAAWNASSASANFEEVYGSKSIREYPAIYADAVTWNSTVLGSEISQIMYSLNGGSYTTPSYPVSIPAGARVNYKIVFVNDTYDLSAFILRFTKI